MPNPRTNEVPMYKQLCAFPLLLALAACDDKDTTFTDLDDESYEPTGWEECAKQNQSIQMDFYEDYDGDYDACITQSIDTIIDAPNAKVIDVNIWGWDAIPPIDADVLAWTVILDYGAAVYPDGALRLSEKVASDLSGTTGWQWGAWGWSATDLEAWWEPCFPNCSYYKFGVEIYDGATAEDMECEDYDSSGSSADMDGVQVCVEFQYSTEEPTSPPEARCTAGSGRFALVPFVADDTDLDGDFGVQWRPVMETGRGAMTGGAIVSRIARVDDNGTRLKVIHKDQEYSFGDDDSLELGRSGSTTLSGTRTARFARSQVNGGIQFVSEDYPDDANWDMQVDMTWSCPLAGSVAPPTLPQGYTFSLADIGCPYKQGVTFRPMLASTPPYAQLELYGQRGANLKVPVAFNDARWWFDYHKRGFDVEGWLDAGATPAEGASVTFTTLSFLGADQCETGTYVFAKEK